MPIANFKRPLTSSALLVFGAYLLSYAVLSSQGRYEDDVTVTLGTTCLCSPMWKVWQPYGISFATYDDTTTISPGGYLFFPLIKLDQWLWHASRKIEYRQLSPAELDEWKKKIMAQQKNR